MAFGTGAIRSKRLLLWSVGLVAGGGFVPQSLTDSLELTDSTMVRNAKNGHKGNFFIQFSFTSFFRRSRRRSLRKGTAVEERP